MYRTTDNSGTSLTKITYTLFHFYTSLELQVFSLNPSSHLGFHLLSQYYILFIKTKERKQQQEQSLLPLLESRVTIFRLRSLSLSHPVR